MKFDMNKTHQIVSEETMNYIADMAKEMKWDGNVFFDDKSDNSYWGVKDNIIINPKEIMERVKEKNRDPELELISTVAHEMYHGIDQDKATSGENELKLIEALYEIPENKQKVEALLARCEKNILSREINTNYASEFLPKNHSRYDELKKTFLEMNIEANQTYIKGGAGGKVRGIISKVKKDIAEGIPMQEQSTYRAFKERNNIYKYKVVKQRQVMFNEQEFNQEKQMRMDYYKHVGKVSDALNVQGKQKVVQYEKQIKITHVKEEMKLSHVPKKERYLARFASMAKEKIKKALEPLTNNKMVRVYKEMKEDYQKSVLAEKERVKRKEVTRERWL